MMLDTRQPGPLNNEILELLTSITATVTGGSPLYSFPDERHLMGSPSYIVLKASSNSSRGRKGLLGTIPEISITLQK
jgi:hypothetical protein